MQSPTTSTFDDAPDLHARMLYENLRCRSAAKTLLRCTDCHRRCTSLVLVQPSSSGALLLLLPLFYRHPPGHALSARSFLTFADEVDDPQSFFCPVTP